MNWDALYDDQFFHQKIESGYVFNPPYQRFPSSESLLTLDSVTDHFIRNSRDETKGFAVLYPLHSKMKNIRRFKNGSFDFKDTGKLPSWLKKLYSHERVSLMLLEQPLDFTKGLISDEGVLTEKKFRAAPFLTIIALFGFQRSRFLVKNPVETVDSTFLNQLIPLQGQFAPRASLQLLNKNKLAAWLTVPESLENQIPPVDLENLPEKLRQSEIDQILEDADKV